MKVLHAIADSFVLTQAYAELEEAGLPLDFFRTLMIGPFAKNSVRLSANFSRTQVSGHPSETSLRMIGSNRLSIFPFERGAWLDIVTVSWLDVPSCAESGRVTVKERSRIGRVGNLFIGSIGLTGFEERN